MTRTPRPSHAAQPAISQPVSPSDVAKAAGVSLVTVSRAMNDSSRVSAETRDRVLETARRLGYRPNSTARALRQGKTDTIAVVMKSGHLFSAFHSEMLAGFYSVVHERNLRVMLTVVAPDEENTDMWLRALMSAAGFDSLVLHQELFRGLGGDLRNLSMPVLLAGLLADPAADEKKFAMAGFDHAEGIVKAVRHLSALGHSRISYFHDSGPALGPSVRPGGFRKGMAEAGNPVDERWLVSLPPGKGAEAASQAIQHLYGAGAPYPTAVICASDLIAAAVVEGAETWGRRVPEDLSVVGYGNFPWTAHFRPPLTALHQSGWQLGCILGAKLIGLRDGDPQHSGMTVLPMELIVRKSTAAAPPEAPRGARNR